MITQDRIHRERIAGPQIVQDGRAIRPGGGGILYPTGRVTYTDNEVQLTRDDRDKLIWYDGSLLSADGVLKLPPDPVIKDTFWFIHFPGYAMAIRPARNQGIYSPIVSNDSFISGYWFDTTEGTPHYHGEQVDFGWLTGTLAVTWCVMQYTGEVEQVPVSYIDIGGPEVNPIPGDGNANYYDAGIDELVYSPLTMWTIWRCRGRHPARIRWMSDDFPF